jgi:methionyl-tRNA synthetase
MLQRLFDEGQIYKDKQAGYYSVRQEQFLTEKERGPDGKFGSEWGEVEFREEENYYFKLSEHKEWLLQFLRTHPNFVSPTFRQTELVNAVEKLSGDLCISRPRSRLSWGIELPFDRNYVNYVWFDALSNYISFIGYDPEKLDINDQPATFREKWPALQIIGKDILIPAHGVYWPIMLHALNFPDEQMPTLLVHGWWNLAGAKMSKSAGNVADANELADKYGAAAVRYYLMSDIVTGKDADFSEERLVKRYNSDLANNLGNLVNRTLNMSCKYRQCRLARPKSDLLFGREGAVDTGSFSRLVALLVKTYRAQMDGSENEPQSFDTSSALGSALEICTQCNGLIEVTKPWALAKDPSASETVDAVLYHLADSLRIVAILISPVLPKAAHRIFDQLNCKMGLSGKGERFSVADAEWGRLPDGHVVGNPVPLFPRIDSDSESRARLAC